MFVKPAPSPPPLVNNISFTSNWCSTDVKMIACEYTWTIRNCNFYHVAMEEMLQSSIFTAGLNDELKWQLRLYTNGDSKENRGNLSIFLRLKECDRNEIKAMFIFSIIDSEGNRTNRLESEIRSFKKVKDHWGSFGWKKFVSVKSLIKEKDRFLPNDKLTIFCEIRAFENTVNASGQSRKIQNFNVPSCSLSEDMGNALDNKNLSDVMFTVSDEKFYAHKIILTARSPVFLEILNQGKNLFNQRMQLINVDNVEKNAFAEMLRYIYTGKSPNLAEIADKLLPAANHYGLGTLKIMCEEQLSIDLAIENAADVLIMADQQGAKLLKMRAQDFIVTHLEEVKSTGGFQKVARCYPDLLVETMSALAMKINGNMS